MRNVIYFLIALLLNVLQASGQKSFIITGDVSPLYNNDSVRVKIYNKLIIDQDKDFKLSVCKVDKGRWRIEVPENNGYRYISINLPSRKPDIKLVSPSYLFLVKTGDSIHISASQELRFTGSSANKFILQNDIYNIRINVPIRVNHIDKLFDEYQYADSLLKLQLHMLVVGGSFIDAELLAIIRANLICENQILKTFFLRINKADNSDIITFFKSYRPPSQIALDSPKSLSVSRNYSDYLISKYKSDSCFQVGKVFFVGRYYSILKKNFTGLVKEKAITNLLYKSFTSSEDLTSLLIDAEKEITDTVLKTIIQDQFGRNEFAKDFSLPDTSGKMIKLSDFKGKYVLLDFYYNGCGGCVQVNSIFKKIESGFDGKDIVFLSISIDKDREKWIKGIKSGDYTHKRSISLNTEFKGSNHPIINMYRVSSYPGLVLIDKAGKIIKQNIDPRYDEGKRLIALLN